MKHLKEEFDKLTFKDVVIYLLVLATITAAFVLLFMGMFIPPEGEIHDSVLTAFGLALFFVGTLLGVSMHYANELTSFKDRAFSIMRNAAAGQHREVETEKGGEGQ